MDNRHTFSAFSYQLSLGSLVCTLVYTMSANAMHPIGVYPLVFMLYAPLVYCLNRILLRRQRSLRALVLFNFFLAAIGFATMFSSAIRYGISSLIFAALFLLWCTVNGAQLSITPPNLRQLILILDGSLVFLVLLTGIMASLGKDSSLLLPAIIGFTAAILGVVSLRLDRHIGLRESGFLAGAFAALSGLVWVMVSWVAAPAGQGIVALWNGFLAVLKAVWNLILRFLLFVASLFPEPELEEQNSYEEFVIPIIEEVAPENAPLLTAIFLILTVIFLTAFLIWGLHYLGCIKLGGKKVVAVQNRPNRSRVSLIKGLRMLAARLKKWLHIRAFLWKNRSTAIGLYYILVRKCRMGPWRKRPEETPREFLTRLQNCSWGDDTLNAALNTLLLHVDEALFSKRVCSKKLPQARRIRQKVSGVVRRQFMLDCIASLRAKAAALSGE